MSRLKNAIRIMWGLPIARRRVLPTRRDTETLKFEFGNLKWHCSAGYYRDGGLAEIFLNTAKTGELLRVICRDSAIAASLALQFGCPEDVLRAALTRDEGGEANSPLSVALDMIRRVK